MFKANEFVSACAQLPALARLRHGLDVAQIVERAIAVQQIPAPTFDEKARAAHVLAAFESYPDLQDVFMDDLYNVYGRLPGTDPGAQALLVAAHLDTVFPAETDLTVRQDGKRIHGPGIGDNSLGVAAVLTLLHLLHTPALRPATDVWLVANSREEGLGDLGGMRGVWERLHSRLGGAVVIEGMALGRIYHAGIAVRRLHITCRAAGGHSWLHFGRPTAVHGLVELASRIIALEPPSKPRTTFNIGMIKGGHSVNSLATEADLYLDLRSQDRATLATLEDAVRDNVSALHTSQLAFEIEVVGDRPAGSIPVEHPLVELATHALEAIDHEAFYESGSTDANMLLANGLPTVTVGVSYGKHAHRLDEYIETGPIASGMWHLLLLVRAAADSLSQWA